MSHSYNASASDLERLACAIEDRGCVAPALLFLEMHRPLRGLSSVVLQGFAPLAAPFFGVERLQRLQRLLEQPEIIDALIRRLEQGQEQF